MTEDDGNEVVIDAINMVFEHWYHCFAKHRVNFVGLVTASDRRYLTSVAPYVSTTAASLDRQMMVFPPALKRVGFFKGARVGVLADETPNMKRNVEQVLVPALSRFGAKPVDVKYMRIPHKPEEMHEAGPDANNAVLSFKSNNVNRVISFAYTLNYLSFANAAEAQGYRPRYAFPDYFVSATGAAAGPENQNRGALSVSSGQGVTDDKSPPDGSSPYDRRKLTPAQRRCFDILSKQLKTNYYDPSQSGSSGQELRYCDHFFLWLEAARKVGSRWTPDNLRIGLKTLGSSYASTMVHSTDYSAGNFDGASTYRVGRFDASCTCFPAITEWMRMPR